MLQGLVAYFHENVDAVAAERAVNSVQQALFRDKVLDALILVDIYGTMALREGDGCHDDEYGEANDAFHDGSV